MEEIRKDRCLYTEVNLDWEHVVTSEYEGISRELFEKAKRKKHGEFAPGDQVLVLIPYSTNKLYARWTSPVKVVKRVKPNSYYLQMAGVPTAEKNDEALDIVTLDYLSKKQQTQLRDPLHRHRTLFSGKIKRAKGGEHVLKLKTEEETMKTKTYKIPGNLNRKVGCR
ncbi:retrovirus-related Pol polyprotein from transposon 17.6 [Trichonephila clavipes]|nr:retrovirus-related Pol polyprotein from transposon 17.6 [Trichonephila clavipes]